MKRGESIRSRGACTDRRTLDDCCSEHACFGGVQGFYQHASHEIGLPMRFSRVPAAAGRRQAPACRCCVYLAGLTCTEETFMIKAGAQRIAAEHGLHAGRARHQPARHRRRRARRDDWDFGVGAGFYLDATRRPGPRHWRMESYVMRRAAAAGRRDTSPIDAGALRHLRPFDGRPRRADAGAAPSGRSSARCRPSRRSARPSRCPGARRRSPAISATTETPWRAHDASALMSADGARPIPRGILVDQGLADKFLAEQLQPELFEAACATAGPAADAAPPCRLRPRLLLRQHLRRRPPALPPRSLDARLTDRA